MHKYQNDINTNSAKQTF